MKRPFCAFSFFFLLQIWTAFFAPWQWLQVLPSILVLGLCLVLFFKNRQYAKKLLFLAVVGCLTALAASRLYTLRTAPLQRLVGQTVSFQGMVSSQSSWNPQSITVLAKTHQAGYQTLHLYCPPGGPQVGDWVEGRANIKEVEQDGNSLLFSGGVSLRGTVSQDLKLWQPQRQAGLWQTQQLRLRLSQAVGRACPGQGGAMLGGMLFSQRSVLSPVEQYSINTAGLGHLLSVSGLHLSILCGLFVGLCRCLKLRRLTTLFICIPAVFAVVAASGFALSAVRAATMLILYLTAQALGRRSDGFTSLAFAAVILVFACPPALGSNGFLYSFCATLAILLWASPISKGLSHWVTSWRGSCGRVLTKLLQVVGVTTAAQLGVFPLLCLTQGWVPFYSLPANVLAAPFVLGALGLGVAGIFLLPFGSLSTIVLQLGAFCANTILQLSKIIYQLPCVGIAVGFGWQRWLYCLLAFLLLLAWVLKKHHRRKVLFIGLPFWAVLLCCFSLFHQYDTILTVDSKARGFYLYQGGQSMLVYDDRSMTDYRRWGLSVLPNYAGLPAPDFLFPFYGGSGTTRQQEVFEGVTVQALPQKVFLIQAPNLIIIKEWQDPTNPENLTINGYENSPNYGKIETGFNAAFVRIDKDWNVTCLGNPGDMVQLEHVALYSIQPHDPKGGELFAAAKPTKKKRGFG